MPVGPRSPARYRRRILAGGLIAAGALYSVGAPIFARRIERDLEQRVPAELAEAGYPGVTARFSGQDGTLTCRAALDDPEAAARLAYDVRGVRTITLERSCRINRGEADEDASSSIEPAATTTSTTTSSTTTTTLPPIPTVAPAPPGTVTAVIAGGTVSLTGVVGSEVERARLRNAAALAVLPENVDDQLEIDPERALGDATSATLVQLIAVASGNLIVGQVDFDGESYVVRGEYATDANAAAVREATDAADAIADLSPTAPATTLEASA